MYYIVIFKLLSNNIPIQIWWHHQIICWYDNISKSFDDIIYIYLYHIISLCVWWYQIKFGMFRVVNNLIISPCQLLKPVIDLLKAVNICWYLFADIIKWISDIIKKGDITNPFEWLMISVNNWWCQQIVGDISKCWASRQSAELQISSLSLLESA